MPTPAVAPRLTLDSNSVFQCSSCVSECRKQSESDPARLIFCKEIWEQSLLDPIARFPHSSAEAAFRKRRNFSERRSPGKVKRCPTKFQTQVSSSRSYL